MDRNQLAEAVGCSYREILRWETTNQEPKAMTLKKIADALGVKMDYFVEEDVKNPQILYYLQDQFEKEGHLQEEETLKRKKQAALSLINEIHDTYTLRIVCQLMIHYIELDGLKSLYSAIKAISGFGYDSGQNLMPEDEFYRNLTQIIDRTNDLDFLKRIAEITINCTDLSIIDKHIKIIRTFASQPIQDPDAIKES